MPDRCGKHLSPLFKKLIGTIHVPIQGPLRTPKKPFLNARMRLEIEASESKVLKLPRAFGPGIKNLFSDSKLAQNG